MTTSSIFELAALIKQSGRYALFLGAGCSFPQILLGKEIIKQLQEKFGDPIGATFHDVMERAFCTADDRRNYFESLCAGKVPSRHHYQIAELADQGKFDIIYTTNFDRLIEIAMMSYCTIQPSLFLNDVEFGDEELQWKHPKLLKLHGDFILPSIANVPQELLDKLHIDMQQKLLSQWVNKGLVVVGYGGGDKTVMSLFEKAVQTSDCLSGGLWWVDCVEQNESVTELFLKTSASSKACHYIQCKADEFFDTLCGKLSVDVCLPHFGLRTDQTMPLSVGLPPMFVNARHHIPAFKGQSSGMRHTCPSRSDSDKLKQALATTSAVWLVGPWSAAINLTIKWLRRNRRPVFYFDYRFARNKPAAKDLSCAILRFAAGCGIVMTGQYYSSPVQELFRRSAVLVFANVSEADPCFWKEISRIFAIQYKVGKGNMVFIERSIPPDQFLKTALKEIYAAATPPNGFAWLPGMCQRQGNKVIYHFDDNKPVQAHNIGMQVIEIEASTINDSVDGKLTETERQLLERIATLRFGETRQTIAALADKDIDQIRNLIQNLEVRGYLTQQGDRFYVSTANCQDMENDDMVAIHFDLAERFKQLAQDAPQQNDLQNLHYTLEAEYHYFSSKHYVEAATILAEISEVMLQIYSDLPATASWVNQTLYDFFRLEACGTRVVSALSEQYQLSLLLLLHKVCQGCDEQPDGDVIAACVRLQNALSEPMKCYIRGHNFHSRHEYETARVEFEKSILGVTEPSLFLGNAQMMVANCYFDMDQGEVVNNLDQQEYWTKAACETFVALENNYLKARALGNLGLNFLEIGNYERATDYLQQAINIFQQEPGFSRDKGVAYGNLARVLLSTSNVDKAEGLFLESVLHYIYVGELEGLTRLYFALFGYRDKLPTEWAFTTEYLYDVSVNMWVYSSRPPILQSMMYSVNNQYLAWALQKRNAPAAAKGISNIGFLTLEEQPNDRLKYAQDWIQKFYTIFGSAANRRVMRAKLRNSQWWSEEEKRNLTALLQKKGQTRTAPLI